jgi:uncharacterized protein (DUF1778 family)
MGTKMAITTPEQPRDRRFQLRAIAREQTLIKLAAEQGLNITDFILSAAREKAEESLAGQTRFPLNEEQWKRFIGGPRPAAAGKATTQKAILRGSRG